MRIRLQNLPKQIELVKAMGSKDKGTAEQAQQIFASLMSKTLSEIFQQAETTSMIYQDLQFNEGDDPSIPIELYANTPQDHFSIWSQTVAGGLPTNEIHEPIDEVKIHTYRLDSAWSYDRRYARKARLDVIGKAVERIMQEILLKTQHHAWSVVLAGLASASHNALDHVFRVDTNGFLTLEDLNKLFTRMRRINSSWVDGTPAGDTGQLTDIIVSPEVKEQIRGMAYNSINVRTANGTATTAASGTLALPDAKRAGMFTAAGTSEIYGLAITELLELGLGKSYNTLFDTYADAASQTFAEADGTTGDAAYNAANDDLVIGLDLSQDFAYRAIEADEDSGSTFRLEIDDQFPARSDKQGWYGNIREGRVLLETRPIAGLIV